LLRSAGRALGDLARALRETLLGPKLTLVERYIREMERRQAEAEEMLAALLRSRQMLDELLEELRRRRAAEELAGRQRVNTAWRRAAGDAARYRAVLSSLAAMQPVRPPQPYRRPRPRQIGR
jgi:phage shock protein A